MGMPLAKRKRLRSLNVLTVRPPSYRIAYACCVRVVFHNAQGSEDEFKDASEAYSVLGDAEQRRIYDRTLGSRKVNSSSTRRVSLFSCTAHLRRDGQRHEKTKLGRNPRHGFSCASMEWRMSPSRHRVFCVSRQPASFPRYIVCCADEFLFRAR